MGEFELTPQMVNALLVLAYLLGVLARIVWPYALTYLKEPQKFDWAKTKGQIVGAGVGLVAVIWGAISGDGFLEGLGAVGYIGAFIAGFGLAAAGREGQKTAEKPWKKE